MKGEYSHSLDSKGRFNFPAKLREELGETFIVTKGLDNCLFVYSLEEWNSLEEKINALPISKSRNLKRFFFAGAADVSPDKQGRILIPNNLREYAKLEKDITVIGTSNHAEIWNTAEYEKMCNSLSSDAIAESMEEIGF